MTDQGAGIRRGLRARVAALPSIAGPTCPVCWPGLRIAPDLAALHRKWHSLRDAWLMAHAVANQTGQPTDMAELDRSRFALGDFEVQYPDLTRPSGTG